MKILHTSDWHLGKKLENFSRLQEQKEVMDEICLLVEDHEVDAVVIAGDLFDHFNPSAEAEELFYNTVKRLSAGGERPVIAIAGNHDSPDRIQAPDALARHCGILMAGYPWSQIRPFEFSSNVRLLRAEPGFVEIGFDRFSYPLRILLNPYSNEFRLRRYLGDGETAKAQAITGLLQERWQGLSSYLDSNGVNIFTGHFVMTASEEIPSEPDNEKPILHIGGLGALPVSILPPSVQYAALGHLHRFQSITLDPCPVVYSGTPLAYSFAEASQDKFVVLAHLEPGKKASLEEIKLNKGRPLRRERFTSAKDAIAWLGKNPSALVELTLAFGGYITSQERKEILQSHEGIISMIPEIDASQQTGNIRVDLRKDISSLFQDYFMLRKGETPPSEIMELFHEVLAQSGEEQ